MTRYEELVALLAQLYASGGRLWVARLCDDFIDPSGKLLGEVRREAANLRRKKHDDRR